MPDTLMLRLRELLAQRRQLVVMINAEKQRLGKATDKLAQRSFKTVLRSLEAERARIDRAIDTLIQQSPLFCAKQDLLKSVPGIGDIALPGDPDSATLGANRGATARLQDNFGWCQFAEERLELRSSQLSA